MLGACKGILSVEIPVKSPKDGKQIGSLVVGNTHTEYGTDPSDPNSAYKPDDLHPQYAMARNHLIHRADQIPGLVSVVVGGDFNSNTGMPNFQSSNMVFKRENDTKRHPERMQNLYSVTDLPPTPVENKYKNRYDNSVEFLKKRLPIEFDYDGCGAWAIDQIFGLADTEVHQRKASLSGVKRVMLHFKHSTDAQKLTENAITWIRHWNETWRYAKNFEKNGLKPAISTAKLLVRDVISDHFPITAFVTVNFGRK